MEAEKQYNIPKVIHYFWLGGKEKPKSVEKCIASWREKCPDFEIKEWNESNYDVHKHPYMEKAYNEKKWAFVPDYGRLDILYNYGGIYMDTDVEVLKDLSPLCEYKAYKGFESQERVNDGQGFGCVPGLSIFKEMMAIYDGSEPYEIIDGKEQYVESPRLTTKVLLRHGLKPDGSRQKVGDVEIFPADYFCPLEYETGRMHITGNTYSIHHFDASWHDRKTYVYQNLMRLLNRMLGKKRGRVVFAKIMHAKDAFKKLLGR